MSSYDSKKNIDLPKNDLKEINFKLQARQLMCQEYSMFPPILKTSILSFATPVKIYIYFPFHIKLYKLVLQMLGALFDRTGIFYWQKRGCYFLHTFSAR